MSALPKLIAENVRVVENGNICKMCGTMIKHKKVRHLIPLFLLILCS